jgi:hypothetical protein
MSRMRKAQPSNGRDHTLPIGDVDPIRLEDCVRIHTQPKLLKHLQTDHIGKDFGVGFDGRLRKHAQMQPPEDVDVRKRSSNPPIQWP